MTTATAAGLDHLKAQSPELYARFVDLETAVAAQLVAAAASDLKAKYLLATYDRVHMAADTGVAGLAELAVDALQATANTRANALKAALIAHMADVGTYLADGAHLAADGTNGGVLAIAADASNLATSITLVNALLAACQHGGQAGVHFTADATFDAATITVDPPVTLANVVTDLNDLLGWFADHFARASV